ncbi:MAG: hypothetical protein QXP70_03830 [Methanomassiliicoccales archaeon]
MKPPCAVRLPSHEAGAFISRALSLDILDKGIRILREEPYVIVPLKRAPNQLEFRGFNYTTIAPDALRWLERGKPLQKIRRRLQLPQHLNAHLPLKWEFLGDALIFKLHSTLRELEWEIASTYAEVLGATSVYTVEGCIEGAYRKPRLRLVYGPGGEVKHQEHGTIFVLDPAQVMFSSANHDERMRMTTVCTPGERVVDMFAGIGHLSMPLSVHSSPSVVYACEPDPLTYSYLVKTVEANRQERRFCLINGRNELLSVSDCDRVIMGYLEDTREYLQHALSMVRIRGTVHFHELVERGKGAQWKREIMESTSPFSVTVSEIKRVKGFNGRMDHMVMDIVRLS